MEIEIETQKKQKKQKDPVEVNENFLADRAHAIERNKVFKRKETGDLRQVLALLPPYAGNTFFKRIPYRLINQIFQLLDTPTALTCRLVCKRWECMIALSHQELSLPHKCKSNALRMLITLFPKVRHIVFPAKFHLHKFEWETIFPSRTGLFSSSLQAIKPTADVSKISSVMNCLKLSKALRRATHEHDLIITILTRALTLIQTKSTPSDSTVDVNEVDIYFLRAVSALEGHQFEQCLKDCNAAMAIIPEMESNLDMVSLRGKALVELDRFEEALRDLDLAIAVEDTMVGLSAQGVDEFERFTRDWSLLDYRGEAMRQLGRFTEALDSFNRVLAENANPCSYHSRGLVEAELYQYHSAIEDFTKAINLEPHETSFCERAWAYYRVDLYENAINDCLAVQKVCNGKAPDNFYLPWSFALFELRRIDEAYEVSLMALEYDSQDSLSLVAHAVALQGLKRYRESLQYFDKALELHEDDDWALVRRTKTYCHFQKYNEALDGLSKSLRRFPNNRSTLFHRSYVFKKLGRYEEALQDLDNLQKEEEKMKISESSIRRQRGLKRKEKILRLMGRK